MIDNHVKNKKYGNFVSISSLTGECAVEKFKNFCSSRVTCDLSAILNFIEKMTKKNNFLDFFLRSTEHTQKIKFKLYNHITKF